MEILGLFLVCPPGLETFLAEEARAAGFEVGDVQPGGVTVAGGWSEVWRANLCLRGAGRVLARVAEFRAMHPAQLDKRARRLEWGALIAAGTEVCVEAVCRKSRIYHAGAARDRVAGALEGAGAQVIKSGGLKVMVRIEDDLCTISLDTSGEALHRRGFKTAVGKAPLRENMAAMFLRAMGYDGSQVVGDPMCGSGTIPIEAAEIAAGLLPGRGRRFAFETLRGFDPLVWEEMRAQGGSPVSDARAFGADRDAGAVRGAGENAARAGVGERVGFACAPLSDFQPPDGPPGIVLTNPPYGGRIGNRKLLFGLYGALGQVLKSRFGGWRVGVITSDDGLARATGLRFEPPAPPVAHGGLKVKLWRAEIG